MVKGCLNIGQTNGFDCEMILAVYADDVLKQISQRSLDLINDGVYEVYLETEELTVDQNESYVKLIIVNNLKDLFPYEY